MMGASKGGKAPTPAEADPPPHVVNVALVVAQLEAAQERNNELQKNFEAGSAAWHSCETVDDRIHDALSLLGE